MTRNKIFKNFKKYQRYIWVFFIFIIFLFLNKSFPAQLIASKDCLNRECGIKSTDQTGSWEVAEEQLDNGFDFDQLKNTDSVFGQIFESESDSISGIELDFDVIKQHNNGGSEYGLLIKEVDYKKDRWRIKKGSLAELKFEINDLEKYRQQDGKYFFPIVANLEVGKDYFFGIDNEKIRVDKFNHFILKGSLQKESYSQGIIAIKRDGETEFIEGDLYFKIFE